MAAYYVEQIRSVQPEGPYLLGGLCAGGVLAFEAACQLQQQGQAVAMVGIIDAADVKAAKRVGRIAKERLSSFSKTFSEGQHMKAHQRIFYILDKVRKKVTNLVLYEVGSKLQAVRNTVRLRLFRYYLDKGLPLPRFLQHIPVRDVFMFAEQDYVPGLYNGELVLFRATQVVLDLQETGIDDEPYIHVYSDPVLGWEARSTHSVQVYDMPGGHSSMLQEPNAVVIAERMQKYIDRALQENKRVYDLVA
jgi:thioesterase domain-containing protein